MRPEEKVAAAVADRIGYSIKRAEQKLIAAKTTALRRFGLTVPQYSVMLSLAAAPGISGAQLARVCLVTPQTMATVLATLESKGLVERHPSEIHAQVLVTRLTGAGHALLREADQAAQAIEDRLAAAFTKDEARLLSELLERAVDTLS